MQNIREAGSSNELQGLTIPRIVFGTSGLGNLFVAMSDEEKQEIVKECVTHAPGLAVFDSAGKYGAGLALECLGKSLHALNVQPEKVLISNKLGWVRTELKTPEPSFEPGVWRNLQHDAVQKVSYDGIIECFEQGNELLRYYVSQFASVHDPDEYLAKAQSSDHESELYHDILEAYRALFDLKKAGRVKAIGVGAKDWRSIQRISRDVPLDWVMIANSLTIKNHPPELLAFAGELHQRNIFIFNSAVFHSGFLTGGNYFDYKLLQPGEPKADELFRWREQFYRVCREFHLQPAEACVQFALHMPGVNSIALSTTSAKRVRDNIALADVEIPLAFWQALLQQGLISANMQEYFK